MAAVYDERMNEFYPDNILGTSWSAEELIKHNLLTRKSKQTVEYRRSHREYKWLFDVIAMKRTQVFGKVKYLSTSHVWMYRSKWSPNKEFNDDLHTWTVTACSPDGVRKLCEEVKRLGYDYAFIDFLCIQQSDDGQDNDEKMIELGRMQEYYAEADACLVYMSGFDTLLEYRIIATSINDWFKRVWTLQEAVLSKQLLFAVSHENMGPGIRYITKDNMYWLTANAGAVNGWTRDTNAALSILADSWVPSILNLNEQLYLRKCTYEQDRVYAIVTMLDYYFGAIDSEKFMTSHSKSVDALFDQITGVQLAVLPLLTTLGRVTLTHGKCWASMTKNFTDIVSVSVGAYYVEVQRHEKNKNSIVYPLRQVMTKEEFEKVRGTKWNAKTKREMIMRVVRSFFGQKKVLTYKNGNARCHTDLYELVSVLDKLDWLTEAKFQDFSGYIEAEEYNANAGVYVVPMVFDHRGPWGSGETVIVEMICRSKGFTNDKRTHYLHMIGIRISVRNDTSEMKTYEHYISQYAPVECVVG